MKSPEIRKLSFKTQLDETSIFGYTPDTTKMTFSKTGGLFFSWDSLG